ncbi:MAG: hypothetical protein WCD69_05960 [Xanthobacteraceae bacterium]
MDLMLKNRFVRRTAAAAAVGFFVLTVPAMPARAAEPTFPIGSRLGLVPPSGMVPSRTFEGFEDPDKNASIFLTTLPTGAFEQLDKSMVPEAMKQQGINVDKREPIDIPAGKGFLLSGKQTSDKGPIRKWLLVAAADNLTALVSVQVPEQETAYSDQTVRAALQTLTVRPRVPEAEQLSLMPFKIGDLAGFHVDEALPGRAIMLSDAAANHSDEGANNPPNVRMFIAAQSGGPEESADRGNFARVAFDQIVGIKEVHVQDAEPLRISNQPGYQTLAKAKDVQTGTDVMVVQWLRFGTGGFIRMIGIARADGWVDTLNRLRTVRDSIDTN